MKILKVEHFLKLVKSVNRYLGSNLLLHIENPCVLFFFSSLWWYRKTNVFNVNTES